MPFQAPYGDRFVTRSPRATSTTPACRAAVPDHDDAVALDQSPQAVELHVGRAGAASQPKDRFSRRSAGGVEAHDRQDDEPGATITAILRHDQCAAVSAVLDITSFVRAGHDAEVSRARAFRNREGHLRLTARHECQREHPDQDGARSPTDRRHRDVTVVLDIFGEVDRGHPAGAQLPLNGVAVGQRGFQTLECVRQDCDLGMESLIRCGVRAQAASLPAPETGKAATLAPRKPRHDKR